LKHALEIASIDEGIRIDRSAVQASKAESPRVKTLQPTSNVKLERLAQPRKQPSEIVPSDEGKQIAHNDGQSSNADRPRLEV
jgi:hypothetical protein